MVSWVIAGWCLAAVILAVVHHRLRRRSRLPSSPVAAEVRGFLRAFEAALADYPHIEYRGLLPGQFACLLRVDGQDTPVSLHELYRRAEVFPASLPVAVATLVDEIEERGLDRLADHDFASVATSILPQVRSRRWIEEHGRFGDAALVQRPLTEDLAIVYVLDDPHAMVFVCRAHLRQWLRDVEDLHHLAVGNLQRRGGLQFCSSRAGAEPVLLQSGDGYDAARVLLLDSVDGLLVAMPDRDVLWVANAEGQDLTTLGAAAAAMAAAAPHPISDRLYRLTDGRLEPLVGG